MDLPKVFDCVLFELLMAYNLTHIISATKSGFSAPVNSYTQCEG